MCANDPRTLGPVCQSAVATRETSWRGSRALLVLIAATLSLGHPAAAATVRSEPGQRAPAIGVGTLRSEPGRPLSEEFPKPTEVAAALLRVAPDAEVFLPDWPIAPGVRADAAMRRFEVYAADAKLYEVGPGRQRELPRSSLRFFMGATQDDGVRLLVEADPRTGALRALAFTEGTVHEFAPHGAGGTYRLTAAVDAAGEALGLGGWRCDQEGSSALRATLDAPVAFRGGRESLFGEAISTLHTATVAVDTDNEIMNNKFSGNETTATNYIASLFAAMNVIYERDLLVRLLVGTTFLRTGSGDPYGSPPDTPTCTGTCPELYEFKNYWAAGCGGTGQPSCAAVPRAVATLLSGRGAGGGASGIAFIDRLCSTVSGYSYTILSATGTSPNSAEIFVEAHEIGHNFGSPHTHCYSPPIDQCYNAEGGCYAGATETCPAPATYNGVTNVRGTLMSYCHTLGGCGVSNVFHPTTVALLNPIVETKAGSPSDPLKCIYPLDAFTSGFASGFENGLVPPWAGKRP